jgi:hypothetical protein
VYNGSESSSSSRYGKLEDAISCTKVKILCRSYLLITGIDQIEVSCRFAVCCFGHRARKDFGPAAGNLDLKFEWEWKTPYQKRCRVGMASIMSSVPLAWPFHANKL